MESKRVIRVIRVIRAQKIVQLRTKKIVNSLWVMMMMSALVVT